MGITLSRGEIATLDFSALPQVQDFPAMQLYPADWLSGTSTQAMTCEQSGAFINLLAQAWLQSPPCSLPDDPAVLAGYSRIGGLKRWERVGAYVHGQFVKCVDGRLRNPKQVNVWLGMLDIRSKRRGSRFGESDDSIARLCRDKTAVLSTPSKEDTEEAEGEGKGLPGVVGGVAAEAAAAYRPLAAEWHSPGLTDKNLSRLRKRVENVTADLIAECDGFTWAELMRRARGQPFIHERISSFDFEWFLKREYQGTRLNAKKVWNGQFGSGNGDSRRHDDAGASRTDGRRTAGADGVHSKPSAADFGMRTLGDLAPAKR